MLLVRPILVLILLLFRMITLSWVLNYFLVLNYLANLLNPVLEILLGFLKIFLMSLWMEVTVEWKHHALHQIHLWPATRRWTRTCSRTT